MPYSTFLTYVTLAITGVVVVVLVIYLLGIIIALRRAGTNLAKLAGGLQKIADDTAPLQTHLTTINGALGQLEEGLRAVDGNLVGVAKVFKLV